MIAVDLEPSLLCLSASLIWAPAVYLVATRLDRRRALSVSEMLWLGALAVAILPTIIAPALAAFGVSLRAPEPALAPIDASLIEAHVAAMSTEELAAATAPRFSAATLIGATGLLYVYGVLLALGVWMTRSTIFGLHVARAEKLDHPELVYALKGWARRLGVRAPIRLRRSTAVSSVCVYGVVRPVIIVPRDLAAKVTFNDLVMMGAHELAHVKRGDSVMFAVCSAARIFFWFNPFVKRIAARAELAAEQNADALVLDAGADRRAYAACFVEGLRFAADRARPSRIAVPVPSFTPFDRKSRRDRLDAILSGDGDNRRSPSKLLMFTAVASAAGLAFAQAAFAVHPAPSEAHDPFLETLPVDGSISLMHGAEIKGPLGENRPAHEGVDIVAADGASVIAPAAGVVVEATDLYQGSPVWGKVVVIDHGDGMVTRYAHLGEYLVKKGDHVRAGQKIAKVGTSGATSGPHVHFETIIDGERRDPLRALAPSAPRPLLAGPGPAPRTAATVKPSPATAASPVLSATPVSAPEPFDSLDAELAGAPEPAVAPEPAAAPDPNTFIEFTEFLDRFDGKSFAYAFADDGGKIEMRSKDGKKTLSINGKDAFVFDLSNFDDFEREFKTAFSEADRKQLEKSLNDMRKNFGDSKARSGDFLNGMQIDQPETWFDAEALASFRAKASADAKSGTERWKVEHERAMREAQRDRERAQRDREQVQRDRERAERDIERAEREADRQAERAEREADLEAARAERDAERIEREEERRQHLAEAAQERLEAENERREARREIEEELRAREAAIAEAQHDLDEERANLARLRAELERERSDRRGGGN